MMAQNGSTGISQPFLSFVLWRTPGTGRFNALRVILYPLNRRLVWDTGKSWRSAEIFTHTGIQSPDRPVKSESVEHLRYVGPDYKNYNTIIIIIIIIIIIM